MMRKKAIVIIMIQMVIYVSSIIGAFMNRGVITIGLFYFCYSEYVSVILCQSSIGLVSILLILGLF